MTTSSPVTRFGSGKAVRRIEDDSLLTGRDQFADNFSLPGQAYLVLLRSPHAHAVIKKTKAFALNVLGKGQQQAAFAFFDARGRMQHPLDQPIPGAPSLDAEKDLAAAAARLVAAIEAFEAQRTEFREAFLREVRA